MPMLRAVEENLGGLPTITNFTDKVSTPVGHPEGSPRFGRALKYNCFPPESNPINKSCVSAQGCPSSCWVSTARSEALPAWNLVPLWVCSRRCPGAGRIILCPVKGGETNYRPVISVLKISLFVQVGGWDQRTVQGTKCKMDSLDFSPSEARNPSIISCNMWPSAPAGRDKSCYATKQAASDLRSPETGHFDKQELSSKHKQAEFYTCFQFSCLSSSGF